jgi:hypothetical protein
MSSGSPSLPVSACALLPWLIAAGACVAARPRETAAPAIPTVASIPVAPMATAPPMATLALLTTPPMDPAPASPVEPAPVPSPAPHVVLVDELPYRWLREHGDGAPPSADPTAVPEHAHRQTRRRGRGGRSYHPAPGVVVDVTEAQGGATGAELQRTARNMGYWPFRHCYEEGLRRDQALSGRVSLGLVVAANGSVERASIASSTLHDESVVLCVGREALHLGLSSGQSPTIAKMEVTLSTGDGPVPVPRPVPRADELREALRAWWPAVEQCYAAGLARHPDAGGRLELRFRTRSSGEIVEVAEEGDTRFADVDVTRCVLGVYRTTRLPAARVCSSREVSFAYAMHLEARP